MKRKPKVIIVISMTLIAIFLCLGCSGPQKMALSNANNPQLTEKSIALFSLKMSNEYKPGFLPMVNTLEIKCEASGKSTHFTPERPHQQVKDDYVEYLVSLDLVPGQYTLGNVAGTSSGFLIIGSFRYPIGLGFHLPQDSIVYLGHITMNNRKKNQGEKSSGSMFPLLDQAASGYSGGTFDINISDRSMLDIQVFETTYPILRNYMVIPAVMERRSVAN